MRNRSFLLCMSLAALGLSTGSAASQSTKAMSATRSAATPEMARLAKMLVGDWDTTETMERSEFFPNGGSRHGTVHVRLAAGGHTLIYEVHSDGSAGKLEGFLAFWW